ncbi:MAG: hypothetical protein K2M48_00765 [Clostridiales bacterium]|nr:hypothetical protein [Clostridiales bacterium]
MENSKDVKIHDSKNDTVAELYALRAGLSVISQRTEEVRNCEREICNENMRVADIQSNMDAKARKINELKDSIEGIKNKILVAQTSVDEMAFKAHYRSKDDKASATCGLIGTFVAGVIALIIVILIHFVGLADYPDAFESIMWFWYVLSWVTMIIPIIIYIVGRLRHKSFVKSAKWKVDIDKMADERQVKELEAQVAVLSKEKSRLYEERLEVKEDVDYRIEEINEKINDLAYGVSVYNNVLEKTYARLLNPADWQNIDLCIFYLQTGRADTIKECLQLVDRQRQNDEIVGAIYAASNRICDEIRGGFIALGTTMVTCLNALSSQMEVMSNTLSSQHAETMRALGSIEENSAQILSASQLNSALLEKANTSSEQLLEDYKYVQSKYGITVL